MIRCWPMGQERWTVVPGLRMKYARVIGLDSLQAGSTAQTLECLETITYHLVMNNIAIENYHRNS